MMRRLLAVMAIAATCAEPAFAQTDTARSLPDLFAKVDTLIKVIGDYNTPIPCEKLEANRPAQSLGDGGYPERFRLKQIGCAIDAAVTLVNGFQAQMSGLAARIAVLEAQSAGGQPVGTAVFDKIRANKVCVGDLDCDSDWNAQLQIRGNFSSIIGLEANLNKTDLQDPTHTHVSQFGVSQDGGTRFQQNAKLTFSSGFVTYVNPCRQWLNFGPDSRSDVSISVGAVDENTCTPISHDRSQDLVFKFNEDAKEVRLFLPRPNWSFRIQGSSSLNAGDLTLQPKQ